MKNFFLNIIIAGSLIILIVISVKEYFIDKTKKPFTDNQKQSISATPKVTETSEKPVNCNHPFFPLKKGDKNKYILVSNYVINGKTNTFTASVESEVKEASGSSMTIESTSPIVNWKKTIILTCTNKGIYGHPVPYFIAKQDGQNPFVLIFDEKDLMLAEKNIVFTKRMWESSINISSTLSDMIPIPLSLPSKNTVELISSDSADINIPQTLQFTSSITFGDEALGMFKDLLSPKLVFFFNTKEGLEKVTLKAEIPTMGKIESELKKTEL